MHQNFIISFLTILLSILIIFTHNPKGWSQKLKEPASSPIIFAGSGTNLPITRILAEKFVKVRPRIKIEIPQSIGSTGGINAVRDGAISAGLISRPLREKEKDWGLTVVPYARTAVVIGANQTVVDEGITYEDLIQIYKGTKSKWSDGREIVVLTREAGDSSNEVLEREIPGFKETYAETQKVKRWVVLFTDQEMNRLLSKTPYAIGLSDMGAIATERLLIKILKINGVSPNPEDILSGKYTLVKTLSFVFLKDKFPLEAMTFIDFVRSREGEKVLRTHGYLPGG